MTIFENDFIKVSTTGRDYDFIAVIENKTNEQICIHYDEPGYNDNYEPILIAPNDWVGLLANEEDRAWGEAFKNNQIYIVTGYDETKINDLMRFDPEYLASLIGLEWVSETGKIIR